MLTGYIRTFFPDRSFGFIRDSVGHDVWFHRADFHGKPEGIKEGSHVTYAVADYELRGQKRTKAVNIELVPSDGGKV